MSAEVSEPDFGAGRTESTTWALLALAVGFFGAAVVDFREAASLGIKAGAVLAALAPFVLLLRARAPASSRPLAGCVPAGWVLLLAGSLVQLDHARDAYANPVVLGGWLIQALGAAGMLVALRSSGAYGTGGLLTRLALGVGGGLGLLGLTFVGRGQEARAIGVVLASGFLLPQLAHDFALLRWAKGAERWPSARRSLGAVSLPFILWALAGRLIGAPSVLYYEQKVDVFWSGVASASLLGLFAARAAAGVFSRRAAFAVITVAVVYGVGLAALVTGQRFYVPN